MKLLFVFFMMFLIIPGAIAIKEVPITTNAEIRIDRHSSTEIDLLIIGEDHDEFFNPNSYVFKIRLNETGNESEVMILDKNGNNLPKTGTWISISVSKQLGNVTEIFDIVNTCNDMANFSSKWWQCVEQRNALEVQIIDEMINKTSHENEVNNLTRDITNLEAEKREKQNQINELKKEKDDLEKWNGRWKWVGIIGIGIAGYFLYRYKGWGKREHQEQKELPKDVSIGG